MTIKSKINKLTCYESTHNHGRFFRFCNLSKRSSMPILNIHTKYATDSIRKNEISSDNLQKPEYLGIGSIADRSIRKTFMSTDSIGKLENEGSVLGVYDSILLKYQQALFPYKRTLEDSDTSIISIETTELSKNSDEVVKKGSYEEFWDSASESDTQSLENVLDTFKLPGGIAKGKSTSFHSSCSVRPECTTLRLREDNELSYIRQDMARRKLKYSTSKLTNSKFQMNIVESADSILSLGETFSREYATELRNRLKEIRYENLALPLMKKQVHNGNRLSRVFNYCFLIR